MNWPEVVKELGSILLATVIAPVVLIWAKRRWPPGADDDSAGRDDEETRG